MNLQEIAKEYKALQQKEYLYGIENGEHISFKFTNNDFYHLLGFQKFSKDVTIVKMIENNVYYKEKFYKDVLNGDITFYETKISIKGAKDYLKDGKFINFCDAEESDNVKKVINYRLPYFTYNNMMELLNSNLIILYNKDDALPWNKVDADKIFFKFMTSKNRNLNFFIRNKTNKEFGGDCPVSFFLEEQRDAYLKTNKNSEQAKVEITYKAIQNTANQSFIVFKVFWDKVRFKYSKNHSDAYRAQIKLQEYYTKGIPVCSNNVEMDIISVKEVINQLINDINSNQKLLDTYSLVFKYKEEPNEIGGYEAAVQLLDEYNIDIENNTELMEISQEDAADLIARITESKNNLTKYKKKLKKIEKLIGRLKELEKEEIIYVYKNFIPDIEMYEEDFFEILIKKILIFEKSIQPDEIKQYYKKYRCKKQ